MSGHSSKKIRTDDAVQFFESSANLARALNIQPQAITSWGDYVPELRAYQLRELHPEEFGTSPALPSQQAA